MKMKFNGIDVSTHNGTIDWKKVVESVDFAIIRAGYGKNNIDTMLSKNVKGCQDYSIDFGFYWFSYALSESDAKKEADYVCDLADKYKPNYPICYDWEYDSDEYAKKMGISMSNDKRKAFANSFLKRVEERGYYAMLYTNIDYLNKGFSDLTKTYDVWLAQWGVNSPSKSCGIWQKTSSGKVNGINGNVDLNISYNDYAGLITNNKGNKKENKEKEKKEQLNKYKDIFWNMYLGIAEDVKKGKYGNGADRKKKLKAQGYDYDIVQNIVNILVKYD